MSTTSLGLSPRQLHQIFEFLPIVCFAGGYFFGDILYATGALMIGSVISAGGVWFTERRPPTKHLVILALVAISGGATLILRDPTYIKMKPTVLYAGFGFVLLVSASRGGAILQKMLSRAVSNPSFPWAQFTVRTAFVCFFLAGMNELIWRTQAESLWVWWKIVSPFAVWPLFFIFHYRWLVGQTPPADAS